MAELQLDANLQEVVNEFPVAPAGTYEVSVQKAPHAGTSGAGKAKLIIPLTPTQPIECQIGEKREVITGRAIFTAHISLAPNALFTLKEAMVAASVPYKVEDGKTKFDPDNFLGKVFRVQVSVTPNKLNGKPQNNVERYLPVS